MPTKPTIIRPKFRTLDDDDDGGTKMFWCPGCNAAHTFNTNPGGWTLSGSEDEPTVHPSIKTRWTFKDKIQKVCHLWIRHGRIDYLSDCTHPLASKSVMLPDYPEGND